MTVFTNPSFPLRAELHCHTQVFTKGLIPLLYDSLVTIDQVLNECVRKNIRILALTNHNTLDGYLQAKHIIASRRLPILLIPACEISSNEGHILAYGILTPIKDHRPAAAIISDIHAQGGLAVAAHPHMGLGLNYGSKLSQLDFDALEGLNSLIPGFYNRNVISTAKALHLPYIVGSDAHITDNIGRAVNLFPADTTSVEKFLTHLKSGQFTTHYSPSPLIYSLVKQALSHIPYYFSRLWHTGQK